MNAYISILTLLLLETMQKQKGKKLCKFYIQQSQEINRIPKYVLGQQKQLRSDRSCEGE